MQGMPARRILSNAFSSEFRQATPRIASTWPREDRSASRPASPRRSAPGSPVARPPARSSDQPAGPAVLAQQPQLVVRRPGSGSASRRQCGSSSNRRWCGIACHLVAPERRGQRDHGPAEVGLGQAQFGQRSTERAHYRLVPGHGPRILAHAAAHSAALRRILFAGRRATAGTRFSGCVSLRRLGVAAARDSMRENLPVGRLVPLPRKDASLSPAVHAPPARAQRTAWPKAETGKHSGYNLS